MRPASTFAIWATAVSALAAAVITSSNAIAPRTAERNWPLDVGRAVHGPVPTPSCGPFGCWNPIVVTESFDSQSPPTLPPGWIATNSLGPPPLWVTSNSGVPIPPADGGPNAAFIDDPAVLSDKRLDSPPLGHFVNELDVRFRHNFNLEASDVDPNVGFDGAVLEVSFDGGNTFRDVLEEGGIFLEGGYNRVISTDRGSPIAGRQAWSGNSAGFITTVVRMSSIAFLMEFRWRMASDNSGSSEGWRVDTVSMSGCEPISCNTPTATPPGPTPRSTPTPRSRPTPMPRPTPQ